MFDPVAFVTTAVAPGPATSVEPAPDPAPSATASKRVVVVFPFVPLTRAVVRPANKLLSRPGAMASPTRPPATVPLPNRRRRTPRLITRTARTASPRRHDAAGEGAPRPSGEDIGLRANRNPQPAPARRPRGPCCVRFEPAISGPRIRARNRTGAGLGLGHQVADFHGPERE